MSLSDRPCPASALFTQLFRLSLLLSSCFLFFLFVLLFHFHVAVVSFFVFLLLWLEPRLTSSVPGHVDEHFIQTLFFLAFCFVLFFKKIFICYSLFTIVKKVLRYIAQRFHLQITTLIICFFSFSLE